jgi:glycosyltransferase involved in cell wall biosynthesis
VKLLVFAHTPPPHHGQSYMVQLMLAGFGGDQRKHPAPNPPLGIECYHVNSRVSARMEDVGHYQPLKLLRLAGYCLQAIWCRFRYGADTLYYVPAPPNRTPLYRDWLVMLCCRPFFRRVVYHWHAAGLTDWLEAPAQRRLRAVSRLLLKQPHLSVVLSQHNTKDAGSLASRQIRVVNNGIPDPCPDYAGTLGPRREARFRARAEIFNGQGGTAAGGEARVFKVLFLAHCTREKGLFDAIEAVALANAELRRRGSLVEMQLTAAGEFIAAAERAEFDQRVQQADLQLRDGQPAVRYAGFVSGESKRRVFEESDGFCFPTYYHAENFALVVIEAMAFGLPVVTTRWRSIPEILPEGYSGLVDIHAPEQVAVALLRVATTESGEQLRQCYLERFTLEKHLASLAAAIRAA